MTQKIEPTYVTFEQAKKLKEKGFKHYCPISYWEGELTNRTPGYELENGETSQENYYDFPRYYAPEQWQVVEWLRVNHGIFIHLSYVCWSHLNKEAFTPHIAFILSDNGSSDAKRIMLSNKNSPQEAYSAAFDYILNNDLI